MSLRVLEPPDHTPRKIRLPDSIKDDVSAARPDDFTIPDDATILDTIVTENGIYQRVADKLGVSEAYIIRCVTRNARALSTRLRARLMLDTFSTLLKVQAAMHSALIDMDASDVGRTYASTLAAFSNLAGQFEESETELTEDDDATAAKEILLSNITGIAKREKIVGDRQQQTQTQASSDAG